MATGWAVGSSAALGLSAAWLVLHGASGLAGIPFALGALAAAASFAAWAYALAQAAYGRKGALVALLVHDVVVLLGLAGAWTMRRGIGTLDLNHAVVAVLAVLVGLATAWAIVGELRARRGPIQWATAIGLSAPLAVLLVLFLAAPQPTL